MFLLLSAAGNTFAGSATWDLNPGSGDWNTAANWTPVGVPNGATDIATFGLSHTTTVFISAQTKVSAITFASGASAYAIANRNDTAMGGPLILSGTGIVNNAGTNQTFITQAGLFQNFPSGGYIEFMNTATAGSVTTFINNGPPNVFGNGGFTGGQTYFFNSSSAGSGTFINNGGTISSGGIAGGTTFYDNSSAANGVFINNGGAAIGGNIVSTSGGATGIGAGATAANGTFMNYGGTGSGGRGGSTSLGGNGANATFINYGGTASGAGGGFTELFFSHAGNATFINNGSTVAGAGGGFTELLGNATADSATLISNGGTSGGQGGQILFEDSSSGGTSRVEVFGNGSLDVSKHFGQAGVSIGSLGGDGNVFLGAQNLSVGANNLNTAFSGAIQDAGIAGGSGGSLTKIGSGTLVLSGANTYTGDTNINGGILEVDGSINSNTFVHNGSTLAGGGTVNGNLTNKGTVSPGDPLGILTTSNYTQTQFATLMIQIAGANAGESGVLDVLGTANLTGHLDPVLLNGFVPTVGESFTFLDYASLTGKLFVFDRNIDNAAEHWKVTYNPTNAILTVAPGNVPLPDTESTLLLLTLSLLGLGGTAIKCRTIR